MRKHVAFIVTSLDGFYEGPNGEFDWLIPDEEFNDFVETRRVAHVRGDDGRKFTHW